ncbi:unnamed protein product [Nesidiocoris tenuis]|uniref:Uncharacterized protein n=1 Tax=Nesidiocoris tenuis TaxID=355587 RepID=A0A6H5GA94_9HEMI|nr:unnamed protein product [Nesidiocoris tenuis]
MQQLQPYEWCCLACENDVVMVFNEKTFFLVKNANEKGPFECGGALKRPPPLRLLSDQLILQCLMYLIYMSATMEADLTTTKEFKLFNPALDDGGYKNLHHLDIRDESTILHEI